MTNEEGKSADNLQQIAKGKKPKGSAFDKLSSGIHNSVSKSIAGVASTTTLGVKLRPLKLCDLALMEIAGLTIIQGKEAMLGMNDLLLQCVHVIRIMDETISIEQARELVYNFEGFELDSLLFAQKHSADKLDEVINSVIAYLAHYVGSRVKPVPKKN